MASVLAQTFTDLELIIVDDGDKIRSKDVAESFNDPRVVYTTNEPPRQGGGKSRNVGIALAKGGLIAFQDDDDEWMPEKLAIQMEAFKDAPPDVGFCFTAVINDFGHTERATNVRDGVFDYREIALRRFAGFLTVTLLFRAEVLREFGGFDETLPSHQEPELMIRVTRKYKGLGINRPLARVNVTPHDQVGSNFMRRIKGREIILKKHHDLIAQYPDTLAYHNFQIGLWYRDSGDRKKAKEYFFRAFRLSRSPRHLAHALRETLRTKADGLFR